MQPRMAESGRLRRKDGTLFWGCGSNSPVLDEKNRCLGFVEVLKEADEDERMKLRKDGETPAVLTENRRAFVKIVRDWTWHKRDCEEMEESRKKVRLLLDSTKEAKYGTDPAGNGTFANVSALRLLGFGEE